MKITLTLSALFFVLICYSQDQIQTDKGVLTIYPVTHGTMVLEYNGMSIYVDPYGGADGFAKYSDPDLILITDIHGDHLNKETLAALNTTMSTFIVPDAVLSQIKDTYGSQAKVLGNGETVEWKGLTIQAIPMYNLPETEDSRHPKGRGNGYIITFGNKNIYISGDTEDIPEMRNLKSIDVAFVCMNLPYTMDIDQASSAVLEFKPRIVYPYHYRGQGGLNDVDKFKELVNNKNPNIEVRLRNWYP